VIECEFLDSVLGRNILLNLGDEDIVGLCGNLRTFLIIQVIIVCKAFYVIGGRVWSPVDAQFYVVIVEGHKGNGALRTLTEEEAEGVKVGGRARTGV
jgi:hypothetical protein